MSSIKLGLLLAASLLINLLSANTYAAGLNFMDASPVGSWQLREDTNINHKGKQTITRLRTSMVGEEKRNNKQYYWVETEIETFKVSKKGKRKQKGNVVIVKSLLASDLFNRDPANIINNLRGSGIELIVQSGNSNPTIIRESGGFLGGLMKNLGVEIEYAFEQLGSESVSVAAGEFSTQRLQGSGSTEVKSIISKISVQSDMNSWISNKVPFGVVKLEGSSSMNGKPNTFSGELIDYGMSGAVSKITKTPTELPSFKF